MKRLLFLLALIATPLFGFQPVSYLGGRATTAGKALPNVTITAQSEVLPQPRVTTTAANGAYWLPALPPGTYDVTFERAGYQTVTKRAELRALEQTRLDAELAASEEGESVTETAISRSVLERPKIVWHVDEPQLRNLPLPRILRVPTDALRELSVARDEVLLITRDGSNELHGTARVTHDDDTTIGELTAGGGTDKLWLFGAAAVSDDARVALAKATAPITSHDTVSAFVFASNAEDEDFGATWLHARSRAAIAATISQETRSVSAYAYLPNHELSLGARTHEKFDINDRWTITDRFVALIGLRHAGVVFDPHGDGVQRLAAGWNEDESFLSFARRLGAGGYARITGFRDDRDTNSLLVDGDFRYLFFTLGGAATFAHTTSGVVWLMVDPPSIEHEINVSLLARRARFTSADVAVTYGWRTRFSPFVKVEGVDLFRSERTLRVGVGARI